MFADLSEHAPRRYTENIQAYGLYLVVAVEQTDVRGVAEAVGYF
jgi:hypothetical protein